MENENKSEEPPRRHTISAEAYLYWIHCNRCYSNYIKREKPHYILACKHVLCETCLTAAPAKAIPSPSNASAAPPIALDACSYKCPMCSQLVRGRQLNNSLPPHIKNLFHPEPWTDDLPMFSILNFQQKQRQHYIIGMIHQKQQMMNDMQSCKTARNAAKMKYERIEGLRRERVQLEKRVRAYIEQRNRERAERASRATAAPSTTGESHMGTCSVRHRPRMAAHRSQQIAGTSSGVASLPQPRMPNPAILNFADLRNSTFRL